MGGFAGIGVEALERARRCRCRVGRGPGLPFALGVVVSAGAAVIKMGRWALAEGKADRRVQGRGPDRPDGHERESEFHGAWVA